MARPPPRSRGAGSGTRAASPLSSVAAYASLPTRQTWRQWWWRTPAGADPPICSLASGLCKAQRPARCRISRTLQTRRDEIQTAWSSTLLFAPGNQRRQVISFLSRQLLAGHLQKRSCGSHWRPLEKCGYELPRGRGPRLCRSDRGRVDVAHPDPFVAYVALLLQEGQHSANGGIAGRVRQFRQDLRYASLSKPIENLHDLALPAAELSSDVFVHPKPLSDAIPLATASTLAVPNKAVKRKISAMILPDGKVSIWTARRSIACGFRGMAISVPN